MYNNIIIIIIIIIYVTQSKLDLQGEKSWNKHYQLLYWILKCLFFSLVGGLLFWNPLPEVIYVI